MALTPAGFFAAFLGDTTAEAASLPMFLVACFLELLAKLHDFLLHFVEEAL